MRQTHRLVVQFGDTGAVDLCCAPTQVASARRWAVTPSSWCSPAPLAPMPSSPLRFLARRRRFLGPVSGFSSCPRAPSDGPVCPPGSIPRDAPSQPSAARFPWSLSHRAPSSIRLASTNTMGGSGTAVDPCSSQAGRKCGPCPASADPSSRSDSRTQPPPSRNFLRSKDPTSGGFTSPRSRGCGGLPRNPGPSPADCRTSPGSLQLRGFHSSRSRPKIRVS